MLKHYQSLDGDKAKTHYDQERRELLTQISTVSDIDILSATPENIIDQFGSMLPFARLGPGVIMQTESRSLANYGERDM